MIEEEIIDIDDVKKLDVEEIVRGIVTREFQVSVVQDSVGILYVKEDLLTPEFASQVQANALTWKDKKAELQEIYESVATANQIPINNNIEEMSDEDVVKTVQAILANVQVRPMPKDSEQDVRLFTYKEASLMARDEMIRAFQQKTNLGQVLSNFGVPQDYRPSTDLVELAIMTAFALEALNESPSKKLLTPTNRLFTP